LAAFLKAKGIYLRRTTRQGGRIYFYFERDGNLENLIQSYLNDGSIGALSFKAAILDLKAFIFSTRTARGEGNERKTK
jgi:hypothetical protein